MQARSLIVTSKVAYFTLVGFVVVAATLAATSNLHTSRPHWHSTAVEIARGAKPQGSDLRETMWPGAFLVDESGSHPKITYRSSGRAYGAEVTSSGFRVYKPGTDRTAVALRFLGSREGVGAQADAPLGATLTTIFSDPAGKTYNHMGRVSFFRIYDGIDAVYRDADGRLEVDFVLAPGASAESIAIAPRNGTSIRLDGSSGDAVLGNGRMEYRFHAPIAYQDVAGARINVAASFVLREGILRFELGPYDHSVALVIDPLVQTYSALFGSVMDAAYDEVRALATDSQGNIYVAGRTALDRRNPSETGIPNGDSHIERLRPDEPALNDNTGCGYIAKISPQHHLIYTVLVRELDFRAIAVDANGSAYTTGTGYTVTPFPITPNNLGTTNGTFVLKLNPAGNALSYFGFFPANEAWGISVDAQGSAYVVGTVQGPLLNATPGALKAYQPKAEGLTNQDAYLVKVDPQGVNIVYATYLGGLEDDEAKAVVATPDGRAIVVGNTFSSDFVGVPGTPAGINDAFILEVSAAGDRVLHGRMLGGTGSDAALAVARGPDGSFFVGGATQSADFPATAGALQTRLLGFRDAWIARLNPDFSTRYATYYGGSSLDGIQAIAVDDTGIAYFTGVAFSSDLLTTPDASQSVPTHYLTQFPVLDDRFYRFATVSIRESFMAGLSADGKSLAYGTYLGSMGDGPFDETTTFGNAIVVSADGSITAGGITIESSFPTTPDAFYRTYRGASEGFLMSWRPGSLHISTPSDLPVAIKDGRSYSVQLDASGGTPPYSWSLTSGQLPNGLSLSPSGRLSGIVTTFMLPNGNISLLDSGTQFSLRVQDASGAVTHRQFVMQVQGTGGVACTSNVCSVTQPRGSAFITLPLYPARAVPPVTLSTTSALPTGFTLRNDGTLDAKLDTAGVYGFQINATDAAGTVSTVTWQVTVVDPNATPTPPPAPPTPSAPAPTSSSGGGGRLDLAATIALGLLVARRARLVRTSRQRQSGLARRLRGLSLDEAGEFGRT